ncbi:MAG TPA: hypothetical protein H9997_06560 [Candidatus Sellimonas avistercoris]|nr:hypothetical protein [Candidatus Sellimonas avistercoris]
MRISEFMKKVIVPVGTAVFLGALFYPLCVEQGQCDYLKLWMFVGIGIPGRICDLSDRKICHGLSGT